MDMKRAVSSLYSGDWVIFGHVPKEVQTRMYETFMASYVLPPNELLYGQPLFKRIASKWVRESFTSARKTNQCLCWVTDSAWDALKAHWATETYKENKRKNQENATGPNRLTWRGGRKGMQSYVDDEVNKTEVKPKKVKMFKKLWGKKDGTMPEGRVASIIEAVSQAAESATESGLDFDEDATFQKEAGGVRGKEVGMENIVLNPYYQHASEIFSYTAENLRLTQELQQSQDQMPQAMSQKVEELNQSWEARYKEAKQRVAEERCANDARIA